MIYIVILLMLIICGMGYALYDLYKINKSLLSEKKIIPIVDNNSNDLNAIRSSIAVLSDKVTSHTKSMEVLPSKVLDSISSSVNYKKGKVGELISYLSLSHEYDRIITIGDVIDFIGIKYPSDGDDGHIAFIDIKTGKAARLSKSQSQVKRLIVDKNVKFITYKMEHEISLPTDINNEEE